MPRRITIYQVWDGEDMALSDTWFPTLKEARQYIADNYGVPKSHIVLSVDPEFPSLVQWSGDADTGYDVHCQASAMTMTAKGICDALTNEPNR